MPPRLAWRSRARRADPLVVAIGEIGLWMIDHADNPELMFSSRCSLHRWGDCREAAEADLIHCRTSELATPQAKARDGTADGAGGHSAVAHRRALGHAQHRRRHALLQWNGRGRGAVWRVDRGFHLLRRQRDVQPLFESIGEAGGRDRPVDPHVGGDGFTSSLRRSRTVANGTSPHGRE